MTISNIWIIPKYKTKIETIFEKLNMFEVDQFFQTHQFKCADEQSEENTKDHDISIVDEITYDVFIDHLDCYFSSINSHGG